MKILIEKAKKYLDEMSETPGITSRHQAAILMAKFAYKELNPYNTELQVKNLNDVFIDLNSGRCIMDYIIESGNYQPVDEIGNRTIQNDMTIEFDGDVVRAVKEYRQQPVDDEDPKYNMWSKEMMEGFEPADAGVDLRKELLKYTIWVSKQDYLNKDVITLVDEYMKSNE